MWRSQDERKSDFAGMTRSRCRGSRGRGGEIRTSFVSSLMYAPMRSERSRGVVALGDPCRSLSILSSRFSNMPGRKPPCIKVTGTELTSTTCAPTIWPASTRDFISETISETTSLESCCRHIRFKNNGNR